MNLLRQAPGVQPGTVLGIRPEHLVPDPDGWETVVDSTELLGAERLLHLRLGQEGLTLRMSAEGEAPEMGEALRVRPLADMLHTFDATTGLRRA